MYMCVCIHTAGSLASVLSLNLYCDNAVVDGADGDGVDDGADGDGGDDGDGGNDGDDANYKNTVGRDGRNIARCVCESYCSCAIIIFS